MNKKTLLIPLLIVVACISYVIIHNDFMVITSTDDMGKGSSICENVSDDKCGCGHDHSEAVKEAKESNITQDHSILVDQAKVKTQGFDQWISEHKENGTLANLDIITIQRGVEFAKERKSAMLTLMEEAPEEALAKSLSWAEYKALPEQVRAHTETPFSERGDFFVKPNCGSLDGTGTTAPDSHQIGLQGKDYKSTAFGRRKFTDTKENTPLQGIYLEGVAVVSSSPLQPLTSADVLAVRGDFPVANKNTSHSFFSGEKITAEPVVALGGGMLFYFANEAELKTTNEKLEKLDQLPGPHTGAQVIFLQAAGNGSTNKGAAPALNWEQLEASAQYQASSWTETKKKVFFIRVDFSDKTGESVSQAELANVLNTSVSDSIRDMSYGKTWIEADVSSMVVRMPSPTGTYSPDESSLLHDDAKAAFDALNTGINLSDYDIVGVHFKWIGMTSGGTFYSGLAGGGRQWLQAATNSRVIVHEFGHNYGLGHASFWDTAGASVIGSGNSVEYGNDFDVMGGGPDPQGHFHPQGKSKLNWLSTSDWVDTAVGGSATHRLYRGDDGDTTGIRGLRVPKDTSINDYYWVGYRRNFTSNNYLQSGVVLNWEKNGQSWLIDTTPGSPEGKNDSGVLIGQTYSDTAAGVHITPVDQGGTGANEWVDVTVNIGSFSGNRAPSATVSGPSTGQARTPQLFTVVANDADGDTLAYSWDFGDGASVSNQNSAMHSWDLGGSYSVSVTVTDMKGGTVTETMTITVNDPLMNWTAGNVGATRSMSEASYLNGRYILTGGDYAYFSLDGVNWTSQYLTWNFKAGGIAYGAGKYVITGRDHNGTGWAGVSFHSNDGKRWIQSTLPSIAPVNDVAYNNGLFVAVADDGETMYSSDGVNWTIGGFTGSQSMEAISFANGEFVAVGGNKVYASSDGISWVDRSDSTGLASWHTFKSIAYADGKFLAGGWYSGIRYSSDQGVTWQEAVMPTGKNYEIRDIYIDAGVYVAIARKAVSTTGVVLVSTDGTSWHEGSPTNFELTDTIVFGNGVYFSTQGSSGGTQYSDAFFPSNNAPTVSISGSSNANAREEVQFFSTSNDADGDNLTHIWDFQDGTDLITGTSTSHIFPTGGTYTVKLTAIDGKGGITTDTLVVTVTDPLNSWTQRTSGTPANLYDVAYGGGKLVAVGDSSGNNGAYTVSTDGETWSAGGLGGNIKFRGIAYGDSLFVACGYDYDFSLSAWAGVIYTSPNGTSWTRRYLAGERLRDISYNDGVYVISGDGGTILRSTDGLSWSSVASGVTTNLQGVSHGDGGFVIVGANASSTGATILKSTDGLAWTDTTSGAGTTQGYFHTEYLNDRFFASGFHTNLRYSINNGDTFTDSQTGTLRMPAMAYGNGIYFAAGWDLGNSSADINRISADGVNWSAFSPSTTVDRRAAIFFQNTFMTVGDDGEIWQSNPIPAPTGWVVWQATEFPGAPALSGAYEDYDGDGVHNLLEYIMGTDAKSDVSYNKPTFTEESGYMTLTIDKAAGVNGYDLVIQVSTDLDNWNTDHLTIVTDDANTLKVKLDHLISDPAHAKKFLKAKATLTP